MAGFTSGGGRRRPLGGRDSRWPLFAQGGPGDRAKPSAWQVMILNDLSGPDGKCPGATDDEVFGVLGQWGAVDCWVEGRKLAVVRELIRRRPDERNVGLATESGLPWDWDDRLAREVSLQLGISLPAARKLIWAAWALEARLPRIGKALDEGRLDPAKAKAVVEETDVLLDPDMLAQVEELILAGLAKCKTWLDLQRLAQRAVVTVDPQGAQKRREQEEKENARIRFWREAAGTCALQGTGLPTDEALKAHAHVDQRAQQYRAAGVKRRIEILRVAAYLDLLNLVPAADRIARFKAEDAAPAAAEAPQAAGRGQQAQAARTQPGATGQHASASNAGAGNGSTSNGSHSTGTGTGSHSSGTSNGSHSTGTGTGTGSHSSGTSNGSHSSGSHSTGTGTGTGSGSHSNGSHSNGSGSGHVRDSNGHEGGASGGSVGGGASGGGASGSNSRDTSASDGGARNAHDDQLGGESLGGDQAGAAQDDGVPGGFGPDDYPRAFPPGDGFPIAEDPCGRCSLGFCPCRDEAPPEPSCADCGCETCRCGGGSANGDPANSHPANGDPTNGDPTNGSPASGDPANGDPANGDPANGGAPPEPAVAAEVNLTLRHLDIPFVTAAGLGQLAGAARSLGVLDPGLARRLAEAAARHPDSKFCLTIVDQEGRAIGHGCCKPRKTRLPRQARRPRESSKSRKASNGQRAGPAPPDASTFILTPGGDPGPPGGYGSWILVLPGQAGELVVDLHPVPAGECGHQYESARHDPGDLLRHLVSIRDGKCGFPTCSRHARESDFEHARPFDQGGRTCGCNCWSCSRSCHQLKQSDGWEVTEIRPGYHRWATPSGRTYTQEPWTYPA